MEEQGVRTADITPLDRLAYAASRSMGALEFRPPASSQDDDVTAVQFADLVTAARSAVVGDFENGGWQLAPAYDITHAHNPSGQWTSSHQMSVEGKRDTIQVDDLYRFADKFRVPGYRTVITEVLDAVRGWQEFAGQAGVDAETTARIADDLASIHIERRQDASHGSSNGRAVIKGAKLVCPKRSARTRRRGQPSLSGGA